MLTPSPTPFCILRAPSHARPGYDILFIASTNRWLSRECAEGKAADQDEVYRYEDCEFGMFALAGCTSVVAMTPGMSPSPASGAKIVQTEIPTCSSPRIEPKCRTEAWIMSSCQILTWPQRRCGTGMARKIPGVSFQHRKILFISACFEYGTPYYCWRISELAKHINPRAIRSESLISRRHKS
ncbi:uncharacterized protein BCR38DRAFT_452623 [Pseudomassariella vexata]|uniref:Uncharacterized protein n=1 Tax=Pseudomassariella vexata TaxID=1141098 RepID=A0A1Y2D7N1_9PEZI|nr:uncharacterized protein BCR38DRAFT_452623 [Pseudomassariella vexata]ORY55282.1 hypothetical protein BCR38DRAFT_452623 [Pseudomassariella vexata]